MKRGIALLLTGLLLIGFIPNAAPQASIAFSMSFSDNQINLDVSPGANGTACTELVISNEGNGDIDVDGNTTGDDLVITPSNFSVSIETGESASVPMCITAAIGSLHRTIQVVTTASAEDQYGNKAENKEEDITVVVDQYAEIMVTSESQYQEVCELSDNQSNFTVFNLGNYADTIALEVLNQQTLEDSGFTIYLPAIQSTINTNDDETAYDNNNETFSLTISTPAFDAAGNNDYTIIFQASTTLQGETASQNATASYDILDCITEAEEDEDEEVVPSISLVSSIAAIGIIALRRRYWTKKNTYYKLHLGMMMRSLPFLLLAGFVLVMMVTGEAQAEPDDMVGHWSLDEGNGTTAYDSSGNGNDGERYDSDLP